MDIYRYPVGQAFIQFPIIAALLTLPFMFYNYRKYGSVNPLRSFILFTFLLYLQCAYYLVILPLPDPDTLAKASGPFVQLIPFRFIFEFLAKTKLELLNPSTYLTAITQGVFIQPLFNIVLTLPFGVYLHYYFKANWKKTLLFSFALSLFFEITQLSGLYGIYPHPYRLFDVDDLMLNTLGGMVGFALSHYITFFLPSRDKIDRETYEKSQKVTFTRRLFAFIIDWVVLALLVLILTIVNRGIIISAIPELLYFIGLQYLLKGKTPGKWFVHIKTETVDPKRPLLWGLLLKYGSVYIILLCFQYANLISDITYGVSDFIMLFGAVGLAVFLPVDFFKSFKRGRRLWYEMLSGTHNVSTLEEVKQEKAREEVNG